MSRHQLMHIIYIYIEVLKFYQQLSRVLASPSVSLSGIFSDVVNGNDGICWHDLLRGESRSAAGSSFMAWGIERTFDVYLENISIYKYIYTYMEYIFTCVCMWCFSAGRLSDEYERLYVYIYIYYHIIFLIYIHIYIRESFPLSFSLALSAYIKCVRLGVALDIRIACECSTYTPPLQNYIYIHIYISSCCVGLPAIYIRAFMTRFTTVR